MSEHRIICSQCGHSKPATLEFFYRTPTKRSGLDSMCRHCRNERAKAGKVKRRAAIAAYNAEYRRKHPEVFLEASRKWRRANKDKQDALCRAWRLANPEKVKAFRKAQRERRREHFAAKNKEYRLAHKAEIAANMKRWQADNRGHLRAYYKQPQNVIRGRISARLKSVLGPRHYRFTSRTKKVIGCSLTELVAHLSAQFNAGMTLDNIGDWHIDHVVPQSWFTYSSDDDEECLLCWHFTNLRPAWGFDNLSKYNRYAEIDGKRFTKTQWIAAGRPMPKRSET